MVEKAFCLASGPSLTLDDVELVKAWRRVAPDSRNVYVCNTTFRAALWADALFAMDRRWWDIYNQEVKQTFAGLLFAAAPSANNCEAVLLKRPEFIHYGNSGAGIISLAALRGAKEIFLLGYDCQLTDGKTHHHGDHPKFLGNAGSLSNWAKNFAAQNRAMKMQGIKIVNVSRKTAITCFEIKKLEAVLC